MMKVVNRKLHVSGTIVMQAATFTIMMAIASTAFAQKTDIITFKNGDKLTVDIKEFDRGLVRASTGGLGTVQIEWDVIDSLTTNKSYRVELSSGVSLLGTIQHTGDDKNLIMETEDGRRSIDFANVVSMIRVKRERPLIDRIGGSIQLGTNYASGSEIRNIRREYHFDW